MRVSDDYIGKRQQLTAECKGQGRATSMSSESRRSPRNQRNVACAARVAIATVTLVFVGTACATRSHNPSEGTFIEEFEGFPIYHGEPGRPFEILAHVYSPEAAARGVGPMKRASVVEARRRGADAIVIGIVFDGQAGDEALRPSTASPPGTREKWELAVAVRWK